MTKTEAGIRELKAHLSAYVRRVEAGEPVTITRRGRPIGRIVPLNHPIETQLETLREAGMVRWNGKHLPPLVPVAQAQGKHTVADLLLEDRE
ncbi:MAG: type II toxin-antitoxin system prevent-host-death family antitoxin [Anaerolineae bacterium]